MNKIYKYILIGIGICSIIFASCNADYFSSYGNYIDNEWKVSTSDTNLNNTTYTTLFNYNNGKYTGAGTYCIKVISTNPIQMLVGFSNSQNTAPNNLYTIYNDQYNTWICLYGNKQYFNAKLNSSTNTVHLELFKLDDFLTNPYICNIDFMGIEQDGGYTDYNVLFDSNTMNITNNYNGTFSITNNINSNYCQSNGYCPTIDNSYCESNGLCTICGGSGELNTGVNWSSLFLNGEQINGNAIIDIHYDNRLNNEIEYLNDVIDINITQNIDTGYIEQVKRNEKLTPTNEDIAYMIQGLQVYIPYLFIGLIMIFTIALIRRFFRG